MCVCWLRAGALNEGYLHVPQVPRYLEAEYVPVKRVADQVTAQTQESINEVHVG